jgi:hypothetical protein
MSKEKPSASTEKFGEWFEKNKDSMVGLTTESALKKAWVYAYYTGRIDQFSDIFEDLLKD